jgi:hypothetical protein
MKKMLAIVCGVLISGGISFAATLTFDGLPSNQPIPNGYGGLNWDNTMWSFQQDPSHPGCGISDALPPGAIAAFSANPYWGVITAPIGETFTLNAAYMASAWWHPLTLEVNGYLAGRLIYTRTYDLSPTALSLVEFPSQIIDCATLKPWASDGGGDPFIDQFCMDSLTINANAGKVVPWKGKSTGQLTFAGLAYGIDEAGNAAHLGKFTEIGTPDSVTGVTWITITAANNDELHGVVVNESGSLPELEFNVVIYNGTGRFEGAQGSYVETLTIDPATGAFTATSAGTIATP